MARLPEDEAALVADAAAVEDWMGLFNSAVNHGVADYLFRRLIRLGVHVPDTVVAHFRCFQIAQAAWTLHLVTQLDRILDALTTAGIRAVMLKGPTLGERLYGADVGRPSTDLDVLVAYEQVRAALAALVPLGYVTDEATLSRALSGDHNVALDSVSPPLELHFHLFRRFGITLRSDEVLAQAQPYQTQRGRVVHVLSPEDEFLFLCVHAAAHSFARLGWLLDLKLLLAQSPHFDWESVLQRAQAWHVITSVAFACALLRQRLQCETPLLSQLTARQRRWLHVNEQLFDRAMRCYNRPRNSFGAKLGFFVAAHLYQSSLHDQWRSRLRFLSLAVLRTLQRRSLSPAES